MAKHGDLDPLGTRISNLCCHVVKKIVNGTFDLHVKGYSNFFLDDQSIS